MDDTCSPSDDPRSGGSSHPFTDVAENYERMENAYLSALANEAKTDTEAPLSTAELVKELGLA